MTLKQLEAFFWAARCSSFAVAADRLNLSTSSLSKRIAELETSLGQLLFDRKHYRLSLTPAGAALLPRTQVLLDEAAAMRQLVQGGDVVQGELRFGVGELSSQTWLPRMMSLAAKEYPGLQLEPVIDTGVQMELRLESGELDFAIIAGASARNALRSYAIGSAHFSWVIAPGLAAENLAQALQDWPLLTMPQGAGTHRMLEEWLGRTGGVVHRRLSCNTWGAVASLLVEGIGLGFLPQSWAQPLIAQGSLVALGAWPALNALHYSFQVRADDQRLVLTQVQRLLERCVNFDVPIRFFQSHEFPGT